MPKFLTAMQQLGFADVVEVAAGADICTIEEARDFMEKVPQEQRFMATSCCPSWRMMARRLFPAESGNISMTYSPMVYTARLVKRDRPDCKVVFVGPCAAKKLEAMQDDIRTDVDFVLTYRTAAGEKSLDTAVMREILGQEVPLNTPAVLLWIRDQIDAPFTHGEE